MTQDISAFVSCDLKVYESGGLYEDPAFSARLRAGGERPDLISTEARLYGGYRYVRPFDPDAVLGPASVVTRTTEACRWINSVYPGGPASNLVRIRGCRILDRALHLETSSGLRPIYETHRSSDRPFLYGLDPGGRPEQLPANVDYLHLDSVGSFNYGHWLVDDLARFRALVAMPRRPGRRVCVLMTRYNALIDEMREQSLRAVAPSSLEFQVKFLKVKTTYRVAELLFPMPVSLHPALKNPNAIDDLVGAAGEAAPPATVTIPERSRKRLFVHRRRHRGRCLANEDAVFAALDGRGFKMIDPEGLSFAEQVAFFAGAEIVVGPMGAAMTNAMFCRPGARVLHLAAAAWTDSFFWDLAAVRGHRYGACYGDEVDPTHGNFHLDPELVTRALDVLA